MKIFLYSFEILASPSSAMLRFAFPEIITHVAIDFWRLTILLRISALFECFRMTAHRAVLAQGKFRIATNIQLGHFETALFCLRRALELEPLSRELLFELFLVEMRLFQWRLAFRHWLGLQKSINKNSEYIEPIVLPNEELKTPCGQGS